MSDESVSSVIGQGDNLLSVPMQERSLNSPHIDVFLGNSTQYDGDIVKKRKWEDPQDGSLIGDKYSTDIKGEYDGKRLRNDEKDEMQLTHLPSAFTGHMLSNSLHGNGNDSILSLFPGLQTLQGNSLNNPLTVPLISNVSNLMPSFSHTAPGSGTPTQSAHNHQPMFLSQLNTLNMANLSMLNNHADNNNHNNVNMNNVNSNNSSNNNNHVYTHQSISSNNNNNNNGKTSINNNVDTSNTRLLYVSSNSSNSSNSNISANGTNNHQNLSNEHGDGGDHNNDDDDDDDDEDNHGMHHMMGGNSIYSHNGEDLDDGKKGKGKRGRKKIQSAAKPHTREGKWSSGEKQQQEEVVRRVLIEAGYQSYEEGLRILLDRKGKLPENQKGAWRKIYDCMHDRKEKSVYHCAYRLQTAKMSNPTHNHKWTPDEEDRLKALVDQYGKCWSKCGFALNRPPWACRDKWRLIKEDYSQGTWKTEEDNKLQMLVKPYLTEDGIVKNIDWTYISQQISTRSHISCRRRWVSVHAILVAQSAEDSSKTRFTRVDDAAIVDYIYRLKVNDISEIKFNDIPSAYLPPIVCSRFTGICRKEVPNFRNLLFQDVMEHLKSVYSDVNQEEIDINIHNAKMKQYEMERSLLKRVENMQHLQQQHSNSNNNGNTNGNTNAHMLTNAMNSILTNNTNNNNMLVDHPNMDNNGNPGILSAMNTNNNNISNTINTDGYPANLPSYLLPMNQSMNMQNGPIQGTMQGPLNISTLNMAGLPQNINVASLQLNQPNFFPQPMNYMNMVPLPLPQVPMMMHHDIPQHPTMNNNNNESSSNNSAGEIGNHTNNHSSDQIPPLLENA